MLPYLKLVRSTRSLDETLSPPPYTLYPKSPNRNSSLFSQKSEKIVIDKDTIKKSPSFSKDLKDPFQFN